MSESVAAVTRAANVEAFSSWSACSVSAMSNAFAATASAARRSACRGSWRRGRAPDPARRRAPPPRCGPGRDEARHLRRQAHRLAVVARGGVVVGVGVVVRERGRQRPQPSMPSADAAAWLGQPRGSPPGSGRAPRRAASAGRPARPASAAGGATAGERQPPRTSRAPRGRGCRSRSRPGCRGRRRSSRSPTRSRRRLRARSDPSYSPAACVRSAMSSPPNCWTIDRRPV